MSDESLDLVDNIINVTGVPRGDGKLRLTHGGAEFEVTWSAGSTSWLELSAAYPVQHGGVIYDGPYRGTPRAALRAVRPLEIKLREERDDDRSAKMKAIARELQTGDDRFDRHVYIDSAAEDDVILTVLSSRSLRSAVSTLLDEDFQSVILDDSKGTITATIQAFRKAESTERAARILAAFATIVREAPGIESLPGRRRDLEETLLNLLIGLLIVSFVASVIVAGLLLESRHIGALLLGVLGGGLGGLVAGFTVPWFRGRSSSYERRQILGGLLMMLGPMVGVFVAAWFAWR